MAAERAGFPSSCTPSVGRLLRVLTASIPDGTIGEIGTGCGAGAAWIVAGLAPEARFVTVERDAGRAALARDVLQPYPNVDCLQGDWHALLDHGPFDLLFVDAAPAKRDEPDTVIAALTPGGMVLLDDLTPVELWPDEWKGQPDPVRERWLHDPRLAATELRVDARSAVILGVRVAEGQGGSR